MKKVYLILKDNKFHRYIYILVKFFLIENYKVYIKFNFKLLKSLSLYSELLLKEKNVTVFCFKRPEHALVISDKKGDGLIYLSADYFTECDLDKNKASFHVPISMHPLMYFSGLWNIPVSGTKRQKSALFIGATSGYAKHRELENLFNVTNREALLKSLSRNPSTEFPSSQEEFHNSIYSQKIILVDRSKINVPQNELRSCFSKFYFFLAASGYIMPLCHNLVEAMSVGTIPIIEKGYSSLLKPSLTHGINAIVYDDLDDLTAKVKVAFELSTEDLNEMVHHVLEYYAEYMTPKKVVERIVEQKSDTLYLNAEEVSVGLLGETNKNK